MASKEGTSKLWRDIEVAYRQVAANHEREIVVSSDSEDLTAIVEYDKVIDAVVVTITVGDNTGVVMGMEGT